MTILGSRNYLYETVEQSLDVETPPQHSPSALNNRPRRRTFILFFISILIFTVPLALWRNFHFSLPLPDFPFTLSGDRAPACVLQPLLHAASIDKAAYDYGGGCEQFAQREMPLGSFKCCTNNSVSSSAVHLFWNSSGRTFGDKQAATIESFLLTQSRCLALWIWTNDDIKLRSDLLEYPGLFASSGDRIRILLYLPHNLSMGTPLEGRRDILEGNDVIATKADILRALILYHYDGIYIDIDSIFLQDICPLLSIEWAYQWKLFNVLNSAAMRLFPRGQNILMMLGMMSAQYPWYDFNAEIVTPVLQRSYFPHCLFDPEWETEAFIGFFDEKLDDPLWDQRCIDHAFIYHYHNQYDAQIVPTSRFTRLMNALRDRATGQNPIIHDTEGPRRSQCAH